MKVTQIMLEEYIKEITGIEHERKPLECCFSAKSVLSQKNKYYKLFYGKLVFF